GSPDGPRLEVDLGRVGSVHVRWRLEGRAGRPVVQVQESYLWDLGESSARLYGAIHYTVTQRSTTELAVDLPKDLEGAAVAPRPADPPPAGAALSWLKGWRLIPGDPGRRLVLEFAVPITGPWLVTLDLVPREPFAPNFALPFPAAVGAPAARAALAW